MTLPCNLKGYRFCCANDTDGCDGVRYRMDMGASKPAIEICEDGDADCGQIKSLTDVLSRAADAVAIGRTLRLLTLSRSA